MRIKLPSFILYGAIALTTLPFLLILREFDFSLWETAPAVAPILFSSTIASIAGFIGVSLFLWQLLLGSRLLSRLFGPDMIARLKLHKWIGTYGSLFVFLHPALMVYAIGESWLYAFWPPSWSTYQLHTEYGRIAFILFLVIFVTSALLRKRMAYRPWKYIHFLTYPMIFAALLHAKSLGTTLNALPGLMLMWNIVSAAFIVFVLYRLAHWAAIGKTRYRVENKQLISGGTTILELEPMKRFIAPRAGQYCYLQTKRFGESHPFSVMEFDTDSNRLRFGIKASGPFSTRMAEVNEGDVLFVDGPYGVFTQEAQNAEPKVLIAGGIGITPFVDVVQNFGNEQTYLIHCNRTLDSVVYRDQLKDQLGDRYTDVISDEHAAAQDPEVRTGRITPELIQERIPENVLTNANIFFCGPPRMYTAVKEMLQGLGISDDRIHYEEFSL